MLVLREIREWLLLCRSYKMLRDDEFNVLYKENISRNTDFAYWSYDTFDLDSMTDAECKAEFRFYRNGVYADAHRLPDTIKTYNGLVLLSIAALCIFLKRLVYPCRYGGMISRFSRPVRQLSIISNDMVDFFYDHWHHLLTDYNHNLLSPANLVEYANAIHRSGTALDNCLGFIDGRVVQSAGLV